MLRVYHLLTGELPKKAMCPEEYMTISQAQALFGMTIVNMNEITKKYLYVAERKSSRDGDCFYKYRYDVLCLAISSLDATVIPSDMLLLPKRRADISLIKNSSAEASIAAYKKKYQYIEAEKEVQHSEVETTHDVVPDKANTDGSRLVSKGAELRLTCDGEQVFTIKDYASLAQTDERYTDGRRHNGLSIILHKKMADATPVGTYGPSDALYKRSDLDRAFTYACLTKPVFETVEPKEYMSLWDFRTVCPYLPPLVSAILYDVCNGRGVSVPFSADKPLCKQDANVAQLLYRIDVLCSVAVDWKLTPAVDLEAVMSPELKALLAGNYIYDLHTSKRKQTLEDIVRARGGKIINIEYVTPSTTPVQEPSPEPVQEPAPEPSPEPAPAAEQQVPAIRNASDVRAAVEIFAESMQSMEKIIKEQAELLRLIAKGMSGQDK